MLLHCFRASILKQSAVQLRTNNSALVRRKLDFVNCYLYALVLPINRMPSICQPTRPTRYY